MENGTHMTRTDVLNGLDDVIAEILHKPDMTNGELIEEITGAVAVRTRMQDARIAETENAIAAYAAMHRANQDVMGYAKRIMGVSFEVNAKQHALAQSLSLQRDSLRNLCLQAEQNGRTSLALRDVQQIADMENPELPPMPPFIAGFSIDGRFTHGWFLQEGTGASRYLSFIGYSLLIHGQPLHSELEPTFLDGYGNTQTRMGLQIDGWFLQGLH